MKAMKFDIYPLQFDPILKERIWGGEKLKTELATLKSNYAKITIFIRVFLFNQVTILV